MTAFFIPGISGEDDGGRVLEHAYLDIRARVELDMGRPPSVRRIEKLWTRRGSTDCMTAVGAPDPLQGGTVMAIFDMGARQPFVVWRTADTGSAVPSGCCEVLGFSAYSVLEFDT
jgi:hypothetical protein